MGEGAEKELKFSYRSALVRSITSVPSDCIQPLDGQRFSLYNWNRHDKHHSTILLTDPLAPYTLCTASFRHACLRVPSLH